METCIATEELAVLAIDDDREDLAILDHHLRNMVGVRVKVALFDRPEEGLKALAAGRYDVVFLDYQLGPECTGLEVFQRVRALGVDAPVILLTDQGDEELAVNCLHAGMDDYMPKGAASNKSLRRSISNAVEKRALRRDLEFHQAELERTVKDLRASNEEIHSFYHTLSHELKTPLTAIDGFASILADGLQGPLLDDQRDSLARIRHGCAQIKRLLDDILDTTRIETGKLSFHPLPSSLDESVRDALSQCTKRARERRIEVRSSIDPRAEQAWFDPQRVQQVLTNLVDNAIKYSPVGGTVELIVAEDPADARYVLVQVRDRGRGIPADRIERIFERLYQASEDDATIRGGLGLGLYLCRELVRLHGGTIRVESEHGKGSTFTFTLRREPLSTEPRKSP